MANAIKKLVVKEMISRYSNHENYLIVGYQGINGLQFNQLQNELRQKKIDIEVVKNSLAGIAFKEMGKDDIVDFLKGPTAILTGGDDIAVIAKEAVEWSKKIPVLDMRGGYIEGGAVSAEVINNLSKLPSLPVLRTQIVTSINAPITGVVNAFNSVLRGLATVLHAVKEQKEQSSG